MESKSIIQMQLNKKKALAAKTLEVGKDRIIFMNGSLAEIKEAITRKDIFVWSYFRKERLISSKWQDFWFCFEKSISRSILKTPTAIHSFSFKTQKIHRRSKVMLSFKLRRRFWRGQSCRISGCYLRRYFFWIWIFFRW